MFDSHPAQPDNLSAVDKPLSPITGRPNTYKLGHLSVQKLIEDWRSAYGLDIASEFRDIQTITVWKCLDSALTFFVPPVCGSADLYARLRNFDWYYLEDKWEFEKARRDLGSAAKIGEIGCAEGAFLHSCAYKGRELIGFEINHAAAEIARNKGIKVYESVSQYVLAGGDRDFDVICAFQVLEHVVDPIGLIRTALDLVKPGGRLILSVPNADVLTGKLDAGLLDLPPHHLTKWKEKSFQYLSTMLPMKLVKTVCEPLAAYHVEWYMNVKIAAKMKRYRDSVVGKILLRAIRTFMEVGGRGLIKGHTLYVVYEKV